MLTKILLLCGICAALLYVGSDILAAMRWEDYSYTAQSVSELRAIGAPTRSMLMPVLFVYALLEIAFGFGVWRAAAAVKPRERSVRVAGALLIGLGTFDLMSPLFQLDLAENVGSFTNVLHLVITVGSLLLLFLTIGFGAMADGRWFRFYSYATILLFLVTGAWTFADLPRLAAGLPTPWMGVKERIGIYGYMLWLAVFAVVLLYAQTQAATNEPPAGIGSVDAGRTSNDAG